MVFKTGKYKILEIKKKTKAKGWEDCEVGDVVYFSISNGFGGRTRRGLYSTDITIHNINKNMDFGNSQGFFNNNLEKFEIEEV